MWRFLSLSNDGEFNGLRWRVCDDMKVKNLTWFENTTFGAYCHGMSCAMGLLGCAVGISIRGESLIHILSH